MKCLVVFMIVEIFFYMHAIGGEHEKQSAETNGALPDSADL